MPEQDFSNREIVQMFNEIKIELGYIKEQTTRTNGRMNRAEEKIEGLNSFQTKVMTMWGLAVALASLLLNKFL